MEQLDFVDTKGICTKVIRKENQFGMYFIVMVREPEQDKYTKGEGRQSSWAKMYVFSSMARYGELMNIINQIDSGKQPIIKGYAYRPYRPNPETVKLLKTKGKKPMRFINADSGWKISETF